MSRFVSGVALLALLVGNMSGSAPAQVRPGFLIEADATPRNLWTDAEIDGWMAAAEDYLRSSERGDPAREEVSCGLWIGRESARTSPAWRSRIRMSRAGSSR